MPIDCTFLVKPLDQNSFHIIDKVVMGHAFDIHNEFGRFCDERIYQDELTYRCTTSGIEILREPMVCVMHQDFSKQYLLDILADAGTIYELKAVKGLNGNHEAQLINYLLLTGLNHGKLINMRSGSVEYRYVSTRLTNEKRCSYSFGPDGWASSDPCASRLYDLLKTLLDDWGVFLEIQLYREALIHFLGGEDRVLKPVDIQVGDRIVGTQKIGLLQKNTAFHLSAIQADHASYQKHMTRLLEHSSLSRIYWINFQGSEIQLKTLAKK